MRITYLGRMFVCHWHCYVYPKNFGRGELIQVRRPRPLRQLTIIVALSTTSVYARSDDIVYFHFGLVTY